MNGSWTRKGLSLGLLVALAAGCAGDAALDKGAEEGEPVDGKMDSFRSPTYHGELDFGHQNTARFEGSTDYHAWDFALAGPAELQITVTPQTQNLDTVTYLYHRLAGEERWGSYILREDDSGEGMGELIEGTFEAGEYRILVKAYKEAQEGSFAVIALCSGDGCVATDTECDPSVSEGLPSTTGYRPTCMAPMMGAVNGEVLMQDGDQLTWDERCRLDPIARRGVELYRAYWDEVYGFEDMFESYDDEPAQLLVDIYAVDGYQTSGTIVGVDVRGHDESAMTFVFDTNDNLLYWHLSNQSPDFGWYCPGEEEAVEPPDDDCVYAYIHKMPHGDEVGGDMLTASLESARDELGGIPLLGMEQYVADRGLAESTDLSVDYQQWEPTDSWGEAGMVTVQADGHPSITYEVSKSEYSAWVFTATPEGGEPAFVCNEDY